MSTFPPMTVGGQKQSVAFEEKEKMKSGNSREGWHLDLCLIYSSCNGISLSWLLVYKIQASNKNPLYCRVSTEFQELIIQH